MRHFTKRRCVSLNSMRRALKMNSNVLPIVLICVGLITLILCAASVGGTGWQTKGDNDFGLWRYCISSTCVNIKIKDMEDWVQAVQAFLLLAIIFSLVGVILVSVRVIKPKLIKASISQIITTVLFACTAIFILIAMATFHGKEKGSDADLDFGWALVLGWVSLAFALAAVVVSVLVLKSTDKVESIMA